MFQEVDRHIAARQAAFPDTAVLVPGDAHRHHQGSGQHAQIVFQRIHTVIAGENYSDIMSQTGQILGQRADNITEAPLLGEGGGLGS